MSTYESSTRQTIPLTFKKTGARYKNMKKLQTKMMDNGWRLCEGESGEKDYFIHPTYPDTKFPAFKQVINNTNIILPIVNMDIDRKGLGCSFEVKPGMHYCNIRCNEWVSYWSTRKGKRRAKYHAYCDRRLEKKEQIEEELKDMKKKQI